MKHLLSLPIVLVVPPVGSVAGDDAPIAHTLPEHHTRREVFLRTGKIRYVWGTPIENSIQTLKKRPKGPKIENSAVYLHMPHLRITL